MSASSVAPLLQVTDLTAAFGAQPVVRSVSFSVDEGTALGIVGESGSGKSITALSITGVLPQGAKVVGGSIRFRDQELTRLDSNSLREMRGAQIATIVQDPRSALDPVFTIGSLLREACRSEGARASIPATLEQLSIPRPEQVLKSYAHQLSGGMCQRIVIAMAMLASPALLIADEPTTALDVTVQAQVLALLRRIRRDQNTALIFISHDLAVVSSMATHVLVMYAGRALEYGRAEDIYGSPAHPYTKALLNSIPRIGHESATLEAIPGHPLDARASIMGCPFQPRCPLAREECSVSFPERTALNAERWVACWAVQEERP